MKPKFFLYIVFGCYLFSCETEEPEFPIEPELTFKSYEFFREEDEFGEINDFYELTLEYVDGDGDIGIEDDEETLGESDIQHVLFVDYFEKQRSGEFKAVSCALGTPPETKKWRLPVITPVGNNKAIRGEMRVKISPCVTPRDTVKYLKFSMYIYDRALHKSNVIESPEIEYFTPEN